MTPVSIFQKPIKNYEDVDLSFTYRKKDCTGLRYAFVALYRASRCHCYELDRVTKLIRGAEVNIFYLLIETNTPCTKQPSHAALTKITRELYYRLSNRHMGAFTLLHKNMREANEMCEEQLFSTPIADLIS